MGPLDGLCVRARDPEEAGRWATLATCHRWSMGVVWGFSLGICQRRFNGALIRRRQLFFCCWFFCKSTAGIRCGSGLLQCSGGWGEEVHFRSTGISGM
jgi:hypothetical protein